MADPHTRERAALTAVAKQLGATVRGRADLRHPEITIGGQRIALALAVIAVRRKAGTPVAPIRLRFDKGVTRLRAHLDLNLRHVVPPGATVLVTVTAPIRLRSKTSIALVDQAQALLKRRRARPEGRWTVCGNRVRIRVERTGVLRAPFVLGLVHNPGTDSGRLLDLAGTLLRALGAASTPGAKRRPGERWLVLVSDGRRWDLPAYQEVFAAVGRPPQVTRVLVVFADGRLETLT